MVGSTDAAGSSRELLAGHLTQAQLAEQLGVTARTLARWHSLRIGPPRVLLGGRVWYSRPSVERWIASREEQPPRSEVGGRRQLTRRSP